MAGERQVERRRQHIAERRARTRTQRAPDVHEIAALVALSLHVLIDGLDGPLARHLGIASRSGSFTDTMADQVVVVATTSA